MKTKIAVLGSTGMAGSMIAHYFKQQGFNVAEYSRTWIPGCTTIPFDAHNQDCLESLNLDITRGHIDLIINCIGYLVQPSQDNPSEAVYLNSYFPHLLEKMTENTKVKVIHLSTDCIFSGEQLGGYNEEALPNETNWYGRSKALGELNNDKDLTLRQSIIGPAPQASNSGFFNWILTELSPEVTGWTTALWNGITTLELAKQIHSILVNSPQLSGVVNLVPPDIVSKWALIKMIVEEWDLPLKVNERIQEYSYKLLRTARGDAPILKSDYNKQLKELHIYMEKYNIEVGKLK